VQYQIAKKDPATAKIAIAKMAAAMISNGDTVFINGSSTALYILEHMENVQASVITNNARSIDCTVPESVDRILTGGEVYGNRQSLVGEFALDTIRKVIANKCFLGVNGISATGGVTSSFVQEVAVNRSMIAQCSGQKIVVADGSKVGVRQNFFDYGLEQITHLITDSSADPRELDQIRAKGVEVIVVNV
jgi:DeoR/GlpR family transcriptional regulator of sugar metabolism